MTSHHPCNHSVTFGRTNSVKDLTGWICHNYNYQESLTHLKLQKLVFYCYGALLSQDLECEMDSAVVFEPWDHGPVNRELYSLFRNKGSAPISAFEYPHLGSFSNSATTVLKNALNIYGAMSAWSLRHQTHLEEPWVSAYKRKDSQIDPYYLKSYFKNKYSHGPIEAPEYLFGSSNFRIDGIPVQKYLNLQQLSQVVDQVFSGFKKG